MIKNISKLDLEKYRQTLGDKKVALLLEAFQPDTTPERQKWIMKRFYGSLLIWVKLKIREFLKTQQILSEEQSLLERSKARLELVENETRRFLNYRISKLTEAIEVVKNAKIQCHQEIAHIGRSLFDLMAIYDHYASWHDKAQILNVHHSKIERILAQNPTKKIDSLYQLVFIYRAEPPDDEPFFEALFAALLEEFKNNHQLREALLDRFDDLFPNIPKYRLVQKSDGMIQLERIPPNLKVINADGTIKIIRRWKSKL